MMLKLLRTDLRSDGLLILVASAISALMWLSETALRDGDTSATFATLIYGQLPFPILIAVIEVRKLIQKRERLLAQLPVTGIPVRMAPWLSYFAIVAIACLISTVMLALYPIDIKPTPVTGFDRALPDLGWSLIAALGALMIAAITAIVGLGRIYTHTASMRRPVRWVVRIACLIVVMVLFNQWTLFANGEGPFRIGNTIEWVSLGMTALGAALALIVADILLDRFADNRLH